MLRKLQVTLLVMAFSLPLVAQDGTPFSQEDLQLTILRAEQGDAEAQHSLGQIYDNGYGVPQNDPEAVKWYRLAAEQGLASAQDSLASMFYKGEGVPQNYVEALKWYRLAAEQGDHRAQLSLGEMYYEGRGVPQNNVKAYVWYSISAAQGSEFIASLRDIVAAKLTPEDLSKAQALASRCFESNFKDCD